MRPLLALLFAVPLPALADVTLVAPVFDRIVAFGLPAGFAPAFEDTQGGAYIQEAVPQGETVEAWSQMITLTGTVLGPDVTVTDMAQAFAGGYGGACAVDLAALDLSATVPAVPGAEGPVFAGYVGCGAVAGSTQSEEMTFVIARAGGAIYTMQWAARGPALSSATAPDDAVWTPRLQSLVAGFRLCPPVPGETAPYASCTGG